MIANTFIKRPVTAIVISVVIVLVVGGLITTYLALDLVAKQFGNSSVLGAFSTLTEQADSHFHMVLKEDNPYYKDLPGLSVIIGAMWINNLAYWGCNQYIIQRTLGAFCQEKAGGSIGLIGFLFIDPISIKTNNGKIKREYNVI